MTGAPQFDGKPERLARTARGWWNTMHANPSQADRAGFAGWRDADPAHAAAYDRQEYLWNQGSLLAGTSFGVNRHLPRGSIFDRRPALAWASLATVSALLVAGGFSVPALLRPPAVQSPASFASSADRMRTLRLTDGSLVTLDAASRLRVAFIPAGRQLWLEAGRARFAVAHDPKRPFMVNAGGAVVIARGTVFDVDLSASGARVILLRGSVEVRRTMGASPGARVLAAGQEIVVDRAGPLGAPQPASGVEAQWPSRIIALDATPLADAIVELNRRNPVKIMLADPSLGALRMSGGFRANDPDGFAAAAAAMFGLEVRHTGNALTLAKPAPAVKK